MDDVSALYNIVKEAGLQIPVKDYEEFKKTVFLGQPLVIGDYLKNVDQYTPVSQKYEDEQWELNPDAYGNDGGWVNVKRQKTQFRPTMTDVGLCSTFNSEAENTMFQDQTVAEFMEVFHSGLDTKNITLENADLKEQSFIIDTQVRRNYPFVAREGSMSKLARLALYYQNKHIVSRLITST